MDQLQLVLRKSDGSSVSPAADLFVDPHQLVLRKSDGSSVRAADLFVATVDDAVSFYVDALKNPREPRWCALALLGSCLVIKPNENNMKGLVKKYHNFWSTSLAFLTTHRSPAELDALANSWGTHCQCKLVDADGTVVRMHAMSFYMAKALEESDEPMPRLKFLGKFIDGLTFAFKVMRHSGLVKPVRLAQGRRSELWPSSVKCLTPNGKKATVEALIALARTMGNANAIEVLEFILSVGREHILPTLLSCDVLLQYIIEHGFAVCDVISKTCKREGREFENALKVACDDIWMMVLFIFEFNTQSLPEQRHNLYAGKATALFQFFCRTLVITQLPIPDLQRRDVEMFRNILARTANNLYTSFPEIPRRMLCPAVRRMIDSVDDSKIRSKSPVSDVHGFIFLARASHSCYRIGCRETFQSSGKGFQRCGGCKTICYSSPECQRQAWSDERLPHKPICSLLGKVFTATAPQAYRKEGTSESELLRTFSEAVKKVHVTDSDLARIVKWFREYIAADMAAEGFPSAIKGAPGLDKFRSPNIAKT